MNRKVQKAQLAQWRTHLCRICKIAFLHEALQHCGYDCADASDDCKGCNYKVSEDITGESLFLVINPSFSCYLKAVAVILYKAFGGKIENNVLCIVRSAVEKDGLCDSSSGTEHVKHRVGHTDMVSKDFYPDGFTDA